MPRTKQTRKRNSSLSHLEESDMLIKDFHRQAKVRIRKMDSDFEMMFNGFANQINMSLSKIPPVARKYTLGDLARFLREQEEEQDYDDVSSTSEDVPAVIVAPPTVKSKPKPLKRQTAASMDDGYVTESGNGNQKRVSRADKVTSTTQKPRKSRSSSRTTTGRSQKSSASTERRGKSTSRVTNKFVTPSVPKPATEFNPVTPKIKPNTPLNILRRPREGEMVLSMQGSPILVSGIVKERTANINVPLGNGNIISLLPNEGLRRSHIPALDPETVRQLQTLMGHIGKVIDTQ
ncbi:borealin [Diachasma alloeum]|uniref:borealin n=1 Tax=Diachasma alloeum TaxID=454923 RepID=UPI00073826BC|nr:borealin [Diachasma alloeum]